MMHSWAFIFLIATLATLSVTFLTVIRMANQLKQVAAAERRISSILMDLPWIIFEHNRLFPQSETMLAFWLSIEFLIVWLVCIVFGLATNL